MLLLAPSKQKGLFSLLIGNHSFFITNYKKTVFSCFAWFALFRIEAAYLEGLIIWKIV
jgi:hypothetical protein